MLILLTVLTALLSSCKLPAPSSASPTSLPPEAIFTAAAQTAEAGLRQRQMQTATLPPEAILASAVPPTETPPPGPTQPPAAATPATLTAAAPPPAAEDKAEFVADVTIPDGTAFAPGASFTKTWRIKNAGQNTWTVAYSLVYIDGTLMSAETSVPLPQEVAPGASVDVSVEMTAPSNPGDYKSYWKLKTPTGALVGMQPDNGALWVAISVQSSLAVATGAPTPTPASAISALTLSVDNASATTCPHTFLFTAKITLSQPATVVYALEAVDKDGGEVKLPAPASRNLDAGEHPIIFDLTFARNINGWARLRITEPASLFSNQVEFFLTCG